MPEVKLAEENLLDQMRRTRRCANALIPRLRDELGFTHCYAAMWACELTRLIKQSPQFTAENTKGLDTIVDMVRQVYEKWKPSRELAAAFGRAANRLVLDAFTSESADK